MEVKPIEKYSTPKYPKIDILKKYPETLFKNIPQKWIKNKVILSTMISFLLDEQYVMFEGKQEQEKDKNSKKIKPLISPIFKFGKGVGAVGCVVVSPPVFLSEYEAIDIIYNELINEGFEFEKNEKYIEDFPIEDENIRIYNEYSNKETTKYNKPPFYFDLYSKKFRLGIKYISSKNYGLFIGWEDYNSTASIIKTLDSAKTLRRKLRDFGKYNAAIFYDPIVTTWEYGFRERIRKMEQKSKELLKMQVRAFINWFRKKLKRRRL